MKKPNRSKLQGTARSVRDFAQFPLLTFYLDTQRELACWICGGKGQIYKDPDMFCSTCEGTGVETPKGMDSKGNRRSK